MAGPRSHQAVRRPTSKVTDGPEGQVGAQSSPGADGAACVCVCVCVCVCRGWGGGVGVCHEKAKVEWGSGSSREADVEEGGVGDLSPQGKKQLLHSNAPADLRRLENESFA